MRNAFASEVTALASENDKVVLLSGDIGNRLFDSMKEKHGSRFFNCGVAEANMTSVAAGLALGGLRPITYTIAAFNTVRCLEQIRVDLCYHNLPVIVVGVGAGLSYAELGGTHHSCEDLALLRAFPNMTVICPADQVEVRLALRAALKQNGPVYIRIGKKGEPVIHADLPDFQIGKGITLKKGTEVCLLATGNMVHPSLEVGEALEKHGISTRVVSYHTIKPHDEALLRDVFGNYKLVVSIEEHSTIGGLGSALAEWFVDQEKAPSARLIRVATEDRYLHRSFHQKTARKEHGLSPVQITDKILKAYSKAL